MKIIKHPVCRYLLIMLVLLAPATLVEGKKESLHSLSAKPSLTITYHSSELIKKMLNWHVSAASVGVRSAEIARSLQQAAIKAELKLVNAQAAEIYNEMGLEDSGLSKKAFEYG